MNYLMASGQWSEMFRPFHLCSSPSYRYSHLPQEDDDNIEGSDAFKYNPRPKGLREYRDCDTDDDVSGCS